MKEYHKIQTVFKRDPETNFKTLLHGDYSLPVFDYLKNNNWIWTEKIDGTNIRVMWDGEKVSFSGKTDRAQIPSPLLAELNEIFTAPVMMEKFGDDGGVCLYGEGYGLKIQKGGDKYISDGVGFILFDCKIDQWWMDRIAIVDIADTFGVRRVPIVREGTLLEAVEYCKNGYLSRVSEDGTYPAEGLVLKPEVELTARNGTRIISKIKHKDFK